MDFDELVDNIVNGEPLGEEFEKAYFDNAWELYDNE